MIINDVDSKTDIALPPETVINIRNIQATNQPNTDTLPHHHLPRVEAMVRPMSSVTSRMLAAASTLSLSTKIMDRESLVLPNFLSQNCKEVIDVNNLIMHVQDGEPPAGRESLPPPVRPLCSELPCHYLLLHPLSHRTIHFTARWPS